MFSLMFVDLAWLGCFEMFWSLATVEANPPRLHSNIEFVAAFRHVCVVKQPLASSLYGQYFFLVTNKRFTGMGSWLKAADTCWYYVNICHIHLYYVLLFIFIFYSIRTRGFCNPGGVKFLGTACTGNKSFLGTSLFWTFPTSPGRHPSRLIAEDSVRISERLTISRTMMQALHVCRDRRQCDSESFLSEKLPTDPTGCLFLDSVAAQTSDWEKFAWPYVWQSPLDCPWVGPSS
jgi:hypothetical protein